MRQRFPFKKANILVNQVSFNRSAERGARNATVYIGTRDATVQIPKRCSVAPCRRRQFEITKTVVASPLVGDGYFEV
ncbi:MAG: hypothetical protein ACK40X_06760 [Armatimonadota bacterium]